MDKKPESAAEVIKRIPEMLASSLEAQTMRQHPKRSLSGIGKRDWLGKWLKMECKHPQLKVLEEAVYDFCAGYAKSPSRGYRMVIYGNNGAGKSHAAKAIHGWANRMAINLPLVNDDVGVRLATSEFHNWPTVVDRLKGGEWELIEQMMPVNLLVLDDLGAEHDPSKMGIEKLYLLLERREQKWTVITTNVGPLAWEGRFEKRIASRFLRNCKHIALDEVPDYKTL